MTNTERIIWSDRITTSTYGTTTTASIETKMYTGMVKIQNHNADGSPSGHGTILLIEELEEILKLARAAHAEARQELRGKNA